MLLIITDSVDRLIMVEE